MMGRTHATSGPVLALASLPLVNAGLVRYGLEPITGWGVVVATVASAGGAMLPDFDHQHASIAQTLGPFTKSLARIVGTVSGGHRNGTHSILGIVAFTALTWWMSVWNQWAYGLWLAFLFAVASAAMRLKMKSMKLSHTVACLVGGVALVWLSGTTHIPPLAATVGVGIGATAHILGDMLTKEGCPLAWPVSRMRLRFASLTTNTPAETAVFWALTISLPVLVVWRSGLWDRWWPPVASWVGGLFGSS